MAPCNCYTSYCVIDLIETWLHSYIFCYNLVRFSSRLQNYSFWRLMTLSAKMLLTPLHSRHCFHFLQNNNITEVNTDTFCRSNDTYYLRPSLSEVRMDGNPVVLSKYPDSFTCMKVLPVGRYRWGGRNFTVAPLMLMEQFSHNRVLGGYRDVLDFGALGPMVGIKVSTFLLQ